MGLIGCGKIGSAVALRAQSFGLRLIAHDPFASSLPPGVVSSPSIHETVAASDIVSLHAPLTETTRHLLNERRLSHASARGDCHQRCRGGLLDLDAAVRLVKSGHLEAVG
jgi:phosphoglycerate dehydrogenase-like enzyme